MSTTSLRTLSSHTLSRPIDVDHAVICSPHELVAIVTFSHDVVVYRLNGQIAFTIKNPQDDEDEIEGDGIRVTCIEWSQDGRRLAIAWNNGIWNLHEAEKGESVFQSTVRAEDNELDDATVTGMSWQVHSSLISRQADSGQHAGDLKDLHLKADLPRAVTLLDVTAVLPRLSALPSHGLRSGPDGARFTNQSATDSIFSPSVSQGVDGSVEVLLVYVSTGAIQVLLNGNSHIGVAQGNIIGDKVSHASHMHSSSHAFLAQSAATFEILDLPLAEMNGSILHLTSSATTQVISLTQYVHRAVQCISHDFTNGTSIPGRFMKSISMTLEDNAQSSATLASCLLHLALTGQFHPDLQEWLVDIVRDPGLKRWDASMSAMHTAIQMHLHTHILPALDRLTIAVTRLRGLARLHQSAAAFTPGEELFSNILKEVDDLRGSTLRALDISIVEYSSWRLFAKWLKMQIEIATAGPHTKEGAETEEREGLGLDFSQILQYICTVLEHGSGLRSYVEGKQLSKTVSAIETANHAAMAAITSWQGRLFTTTQQLDLHSQGDEVLDVSMQDMLSDTLLASSQLAVIKHEPDHDRLALTKHSITRTDSQGPAVLTSTLLDNVQLDNIVDAKFYASGSKILCLEHDISATEVEPKCLLTAFDIVTKQSVMLHHFGSGQLPQRILVGGRHGKEFCFVVAKGLKSWQILDLHAANIVVSTESG